MSNPLVSCLCCTYNRKEPLEEAIQCFVDQDYKNKELIILNDQEGITLKLDNPCNNIKIINYPTRFNSLGEKRNHLNSLATGEYICVWDDDDLYIPFRISQSIQGFKNKSDIDIVKQKYALMSVNNCNYKLVRNLFHSQACITKEYINKTQYIHKSVGEDIEFEKNARIHSIDIRPFVAYIYRWGGKNIHHLSGIADEKRSWIIGKEKALKECSGKKEIIIKPQFYNNYWKDIEQFWFGVNKEYAKMWKNQIDY